MLQEIAGEKED